VSGECAARRSRVPAEYVRASADCEQLDSAGMYTLVEGQGGALLCGKFERLAGPTVVM
jgi:hypothetical protein